MAICKVRHLQFGCNRKDSFGTGWIFLWVVVCFSAFSCVQANGQSMAKGDSLAWKAYHMPNDTNKLKLLEKLCVYHIEVSSDWAKAWKYADSLKILSKSLNREKEYQNSQYFYGVISYYQGKYNEALGYFQPYVEFAKKQGDSVLLSKGLYHTAVIHIYLGNYDKSLAYFYQILAIEEKAGNSKKIATILNSVGGVYKMINQYQRAISTYLQAAGMFKKSGLNVDYAMSLQNLGNIYIEVAKYDSALLCYNQALKIFTDFKNPVFIATVLGNLGNLYEAKNDYARAVTYHLKALDIWKKETKRSSLANCLDNLGKSYLKLGNSGKADNYLKQALQISLELKAKPLLLDIYTNLNNLNYQRNNFKMAYHYYSLANQIKDSIYNEKNAKQISLLETRYETEKKDKQIALLAKEKEIDKKESEKRATLNKAVAGVLVLLLLIAVLVVYLYRQRLLLAKRNNQFKEAEFKRQVVELEMKALRAQINPHFLFNCMNAINLMIMKKENENASRYLAKFTKLVRLILENAEASSVTIENEMALLESYIQLEELRLPGQLLYSISIDEDISAGDTYMPSMVLQPFVENAIWHGLVHKESSPLGKISIDVKKYDGQLLCTIEDDGVGREKAKQLRDKSILKNKSMGIKITEERLRLLSRKLSEQFVQINDLKDAHDQAAGTRITLHIPIYEP